MTLNINLLIHAAMLAVDVLAFIAPSVPPKYAALVVAITASLQAVVSAAAHYKNPDGSPATEPWDGGKK